MKIIIAAGGTGGHINPGIAIAKFIKSRKSDVQILFVGTKNGMESHLVPREGFEIKFIDITGFKRSLSFKNLKTISQIFSSRRAAYKIIKEFNADLVIGMGGYVCAPVVMAAKALNIPSVVHEQNAIPGASVKWLYRYTDKILLSFEESRRYFKKQDKLVLVGNPVRDDMLYIDKRACKEQLQLDDCPYVLSFGGSLGSRRFNEIMAEYALCMQNDEKSNYFHLHTAGKFGMKWLPKFMQEKGVHIDDNSKFKLVEYVYDMPVQMNAADLVICRAGALTLAELSATATPSILIPSPNVAHNHQYYNARAYADKGAAVLMTEETLSGQQLYSQVKKLLKDREGLHKMGKNAENLGIFDATGRIYDICMRTIGEKRKT